MYRTEDTLSGRGGSNARFEGYCADLADILADKLPFRYHFDVLTQSLQHCKVMDVTAS